MTIIDDTSSPVVALRPERQPLNRPREVRDRLLALRDRCLTNTRFIRLAERFPLTRAVARREASALFDLCAGFTYSQTLLACVRVGLFDALHRGPMTVTELASAIDLEEDATRRLLTAATALRLANRRSGGRYGLGQLGCAVIASPGLQAMIEHHTLLYADLADPVRLFRANHARTVQTDGAAIALNDMRPQATGTNLAAFWPYVSDTYKEAAARDTSAYSDLMAATQPAIATEILDAVDFRRYRKVMDVAGGDGAFIVEAARRFPHLDLTLFDLPAVANAAAFRFEAAAFAVKAEAIGGDFKTGPLPTGADAITLIRVLLDHDDETVLKLLKSARAALPDHGTLIVAEPMAETKGVEKVAAYFSLYLLAMGRGRPRTRQRLTELLKLAGFSSVRHRATCQPLLAQILLARP